MIMRSAQFTRPEISPMSRLFASLVRCAASAGLVVMAGVMAPAYADEPLTLAQTPLYLGGGVSPNLIMAVDDSNSMFSERSFEGGDGWLGWNDANKSFFLSGQPEQFNHIDPFEDDTTNAAAYALIYADGEGTAPYIGGTAIPPFDVFGFLRSPDVNRSYFNPRKTYTPWKKEDGSLWPDADPAAARKDPRSGAAFIDYPIVYDLSNGKGRKVPTDYGFRFIPGMTIPAGTIYYTKNSDPICGGLPGTGGEWVELSQDHLISSNSSQICNVNISYYPATFYLRDPATLPAEFGYAVAPLFVADATGPGGTGLYKYEIRVENFSSGESYKAAMQNFANWFQYHRTRFLATVASMTDALIDVKRLRIGQFAINNLEQLKMFDIDKSGERSQLFDKITNFYSSILLGQGAYKGTPNRDAVEHIGKQYKRTDALAPITEACQTNVGMLFTDGYTTKDNGPVSFGNADGALQSPFADGHSDTMADIVTAYYEGNQAPLRTGAEFPAGKVPVPESCSTGDPAPGIDCEADLHLRFNAIAFGTAGKIFGVNQAATENPHETPPDWNSQASPKLKSDQGAIDEIWHATLNGRGSFVNAEDPEDVTNAMRAAISAAGTSSFSGGTAASSTRREAGFLGYTPSYSTEDWTGDVSANTLNQDGTLATQAWSAAAKLEEINVGDRKVYFVSEENKLKEFTAENLGDPVEALGLPSSTPYGVSVDEVVQYLRGEHSQENRFPGGKLRNRSTRIGDIFGSQPEVLTAAGYGYSGLPKEQGGGLTGPNSYGEFLEAKKDRVPVLFVGSNNGMLHAFNASASEDGGKELFALIPNSVTKNLGKLPDPNYKHRYFVDGSPVQGDAFDGSAWRTVLVTPMGAGGNSVVAMDVTNPAVGFEKDDFLWEFKDPDLNETIGKPHIVLLEDGTWAAIFGSGWEQTFYVSSGEPNYAKQFLFAVNLFTGELISKLHINGTSSNGDMSEYEDGLINLVPVDSDFDLHADTIYAADYDGLLWRIDVDENNGKILIGNAGKPLYRPTGPRSPKITGGIDSFPHHVRGQMIFFGTGRYLMDEDANLLPIGGVQSFFGVWDDPEKIGQEVKRMDLHAQKIVSEEVVDGVTLRTIEDAPVNWQTQRGWVVDLIVDGAGIDLDGDGVIDGSEQFLGHPTVALGKVIFTTYAPPTGSCESGGHSRLYTLSATNGGGEFAVGGDGQTFGAAEISQTSAGLGPIIAPTLVATPPEPVCIPGSPDCPVPLLTPDDQGNVAAAPSPGCRTALGVLLGDQLLNFANITCGRQSWNQVR